MLIKSLLGAVATIALASAAQAVNVSVWTNQPASVTQNATIAQAAGLGAPNVTTTVAGIAFTTNNSDATTVGEWLGNPPLSSTLVDNSYMLFTGTIFLTAGDNFFTIQHDDGLQLSLDGGIGLVVNVPGPTPPITTPFDIVAPSTGTFNFTMSYGECCDGPAVLSWRYPTGAPVGDLPEPATWAMMLLGFGGIGIALRRRKQDVAPKMA